MPIMNIQGQTLPPLAGGGSSLSQIHNIMLK